MRLLCGHAASEGVTALEAHVAVDNIASRAVAAGAGFVEAGEFTEAGWTLMVRYVRAAKGRLILVCGLPGAGKSMLGRRLVAELPAITFCPDDWIDDLGVDFRDVELRYRLEQRFCSIAWELLVLGQSVILEFGLWGRDERDVLRLAARAHGVPVELLYLDVPLDELWRRVRARNERGAPGTVVMSRAELEGYANIFQAPGPEELALFDEPHPARPGKEDPDT